MGEVFAGRYELVDLLGEGGMGSVWRVWDRREERLVAAKVLRQSDAVSLLRFVREQAVRIRHDHVLTPLGWAGEDDRVLFTMPVVDGGSVSTLVGDHGPLPPVLAAEILRQLLAALGAVHGAGVVHRDVKPANVLLVATGGARPHALLTDFGIAVDESAPRFTRGGGVTGTPGYIAPEAELGAEPSPGADLYAAGQVGRAMLTGIRPSDPAATRRPDAVPTALWDVVTALCDPDPAARPASARDALALLELPSLAWSAEAMGDVEVLTHVQPPGDGRPQLRVEPPDELPTRPAATPRLPVPTLTPGPAGDGTPSGTPSSQAASSGASGTADSSDVPSTTVRRTIVSLAVLTVVAAVAGLAWWAGRDAPDRADQGRPPSMSGVPTTPGPSPSSSPGSTPSATPSPSPSATSGSVDVGTVVIRVGQPCLFSDVGIREETVGGDAVICVRRTDGSYAWDAPTP